MCVMLACAKVADTVLGCYCAVANVRSTIQKPRNRFDEWRPRVRIM